MEDGPGSGDGRFFLTLIEKGIGTMLLLPARSFVVFLAESQLVEKPQPTAVHHPV